MKKIITLLSLFTGVISHAQYIDHYKFDVQASANFGFYTGGDSSPVNVSSDLTDMQYEVAAYMKSEFGSSKSYGFVLNYLKSSTDFSDIYTTNYDIISTNVNSSYISIGPSYKKSYTSFLGKFTNSFALTPGVGFYKRSYAANEYSGDVTSTAFNFQLSGTYSYRIVEPLEVFYTMSFNLIYFNSFKSTLPETVSPFGGLDKSATLIGIRVGLGLKYKL